MSKVNVQFSDSKETTIIAYFAGPQDITIYANQEVIDSTDGRYVAFFDSLPVVVQQSMPAPD